MRSQRWILLSIVTILLLPWLGEVLFNTKGEPREAIVAMSMLQSGNWVLPESYGADIPYKPPFLAWLIAIFSFIFNGGEVNEFTSRLPSALAAIAMIMAGFSWANRWRGAVMASSMAVVTITCFEVFRSSMACRVDMVLTSCMVVAFYQMHGLIEWRDRRWLRLLAIVLLLSGAVLTKGPVGALLPCLAMGIYCLVRRHNFFVTLGWLSVVCIASFILPAIWYLKAYQMAGDEFLTLALEENIGRLTGTMTYESHLNPWYYNLIAIVSGMLPWTLLAIVAFVWALLKKGQIKDAWTKLRHALQEPDGLFAFTVSVVVFVFYCIPASKRSVYLLPMYPFMAYAMGALASKLSKKAPMHIYARFMTILALIAPLAAIGLQFWHIKSLPIEPMPWWRYPLALLPVFIALWLLSKRYVNCYLSKTMISTIALYLAYSSAFMPMVLNAKSDLHSIEPVEECLRQNLPVFTSNEDPLMRYYTLNFYLNDQLRRIDNANLEPIDEFVLLINPNDIKSETQFDGFEIVNMEEIIHKSCDTRRPVALVRYKRR